MLWLAALTLVMATVEFIASRRDAQPPPTTETSAALQQPESAAVPNVHAAESKVAPADREAPASAERLRARAQRDALRAQIIDAQRSARAANERERSSAPAAARGRPSPADDPDRPGELVDRLGGRGELVAHLNREFIPLARDCVEQAQERSPHLRGMLALQVETVSDEQLGALVERAELPASSEVQERELAECLRENAMTITFPPPLATGAEKFELTLRVEPPTSDERR
jgi:hypothetical protein